MLLVFLIFFPSFFFSEVFKAFLNLFLPLAFMQCFIVLSALIALFLSAFSFFWSKHGLLLWSSPNLPSSSSRFSLSSLSPSHPSHLCYSSLFIFLTLFFKKKTKNSKVINKYTGKFVLKMCSELLLMIKTIRTTLMWSLWTPGWKKLYLIKLQDKQNTKKLAHNNRF